MEKIFDIEVIKYLRDTGITRAQIAKIQKTKLKEYAISTLKKIIDAIQKEEEFDTIEPFTCYDRDSYNLHISFNNLEENALLLHTDNDELENALLLDIDNDSSKKRLYYSSDIRSFFENIAILNRVILHNPDWLSEEERRKREED